jgi:hypothetical protein
MKPEEAKVLEDRIATWVTEAPEVIAALLYRQLNRVRSMRMDGIDARIQRLEANADISASCGCGEIKHPSSQPFSHYI